MIQNYLTIWCHASLYSVARAKDILSDIKASKGRQLSSRGRMQDVLLQAIHQAQSIIETKLNGVSFCQEYVALGHLIQRVESCKESTGQLRQGLDKVRLVYLIAGKIFEGMQKDRYKCFNLYKPFACDIRV